MEKWQYYGLFLDEETKEKLRDLIRQHGWNDTFEKREKEYLDHCTLLHKSQREEWLEVMLNNDLGYKFHITVLAIGISDKAMAFKVKRSGIVTPCKNVTPHITICTFNGGKSVESNNITKWYPLNIPIEIETTLKRV